MSISESKSNSSPNMPFTVINGFRFVKLEEMKDDKQSMYSLLKMDYEEEPAEVCPKCGGKLYKHGYRVVTVSDTPMFGKPVKLDLRFPRRRCKECQAVWVPELAEVDENHMMTKRAFKCIANESLRRSFEDVSQDYGINPRTAKNAFVDYLNEQSESIRFETPVFLGLDEIKLKKLGEVTVITDLEHRTLYDILSGRNQDALIEYFSKIPNPERVEWVCTDMYRPFRKMIQTTLPNARWVVDHFHLVAYANRALDAVRKDVQSRMKKKDRIKTKKGLAYTLRTRQRALSPEEASKIRFCRNNPDLQPLATAFDLKEDFFNIYDEHPTSKEEAQEAFARWEQSIPKDTIYDSFRELAKTVHNFYEEIFNYWVCPLQITNGFTECTNRLIRENNIRGRGNSFEVLRGRTLYRKTNLDRVKDFGMLLGPVIPKTGPVFNYEEVNGLPDNTTETITADDYSGPSYEPLIGLIPWKDFDPETGEIYEEYDDDET